MRTERMMRCAALFLAVLGAPVAAWAADEVFQFQLAPDPANMAARTALAPQVDLAGERLEYTLDLGAARTLSVRGNNFGCKWSGK